MATENRKGILNMQILSHVDEVDSSDITDGTKLTGEVLILVVQVSLVVYYCFFELPQHATNLDTMARSHCRG